MEYAGMAHGFLGISTLTWGRVQSGTTYILPAPSGTVTTTTPAMCSTSPAVPTSTPDDKSSGGLSTTIIVVIAVVCIFLFESLDMRASLVSFCGCLFLLCCPWFAFTEMCLYDVV